MSTETHCAAMSPNWALPVRDRHIWSLFEDWCTAHERSALPATAHTLALFLGAHPAADTTQRRRIAVIDTAHRRHTMPSPGRSETVRVAIDQARSAKREEFAIRIAVIVAGLPVSGWPTALFTRRDAMLLTVATTGLPYTQIAALRVCDVTADPATETLRILMADRVEAATPRRWKLREPMHRKCFGNGSKCSVISSTIGAPACSPTR